MFTKQFASQPWSELPATPQAAMRDLTAALSQRRNDLEAPARRLAPVVGQVLEALAVLPRCRLARMSGSGATCFGLFDDLADAETAAGVIEAGADAICVTAAVGAAPEPEAAAARLVKVIEDAGGRT